MCFLVFIDKIDICNIIIFGVKWGENNEQSADTFIYRSRYTHHGIWLIFQTDQNRNETENEKRLPSQISIKNQFYKSVHCITVVYMYIYSFIINLWPFYNHFCHSPFSSDSKLGIPAVWLFEC